MPKVGLIISPVWTPHFGWTPKHEYSDILAINFDSVWRNLTTDVQSVHTGV